MAQEKVMNMLKTDGTTVQTRVNDLKQISFLGSDLSGQGLMVKTLGGETATVLFETDPVVTVGEGKLIVRPKTAETLEMEIADIAEILASTVLDPSQGDQVVTPSDEEYDGEFGAKGYGWDE